MTNEHSQDDPTGRRHPGNRGSSRLLATARHAVFFAGVNTLLVLIWAISERHTTFWPAWVMAIWLPILTLHVWSALGNHHGQRWQAAG
jgi:hypothetical protein